MSKARRPSGRYRDTEVRAMVENYQVLLEDRGTHGAGLRALVRVADLKRTWRKLSPTEREVLLVCGVLGLSSRDAAPHFEKSYSWVQRNYNVALENLTWLMNGGT